MYLSIGRKKPTSVQNFLEDILSQKLTETFNRVHVITARRDKDIIRTNLQENRCIFNQIRHIQDMGKKLLNLPKKHPTLYHIGYVVNTPIRSEQQSRK